MHKPPHPIPFFYLPLWLLLTGSIISCDTRVKAHKAEIGDAIQKDAIAQPPSATYVIDTSQSELTWIGAKMTGRHNGVFIIRSSHLYMHNGLLSGGRIVIDMASLRTTDKTIDQTGNDKLTKHLKSADFFDTERYPMAVFELTGVAPYDSTQARAIPTATKDSDLRVSNLTHRLTGNLTIKNQTRSVSFPARLTLQDNTLKAKANFNIDRTKWGLVYRSDQSLGDQTIYADVNIGLDITAKP